MRKIAIHYNTKARVLKIKPDQLRKVEVGAKKAYNTIELEMIIKFTNYYIISSFYR